MAEVISKIKKRSGEIVDFDKTKIVSAISNAAESVGILDKELPEQLSEQVVNKLQEKFHSRSIPAVEEVQDVVEEVLIENKRIKIAKNYILYRDQRSRLRDMKDMVNSNELIEGYLQQTDWKVRENSNMDYSLQGLNNHLSSAISSNYWLNKVYTSKIRNAHKEGDMHIHDLQLIAPYCAGWDLKDLLMKGFGGVSGKVESRPPKHFRAALGQAINFLYTLQGEVAGAGAAEIGDLPLHVHPREGALQVGVEAVVGRAVERRRVPLRDGLELHSLREMRGRVRRHLNGGGSVRRGLPALQEPGPHAADEQEQAEHAPHANRQIANDGRTRSKSHDTDWSCERRLNSGRPTRAEPAGSSLSL